MKKVEPFFDSILNVGCGRTNPWLRVGDTPQQVTSSSSGVLPARMTRHARPRGCIKSRFWLKSLFDYQIVTNRKMPFFGLLTHPLIGMACLQHAPPGEAYCVYWWANVVGETFSAGSKFRVSTAGRMSSTMCIFCQTRLGGFNNSEINCKINTHNPLTNRSI